MHSHSGLMAFSELPLIEAALMAIAQINQAGGVLGKRVEPVVEDGASEPATFAAKASELICGHGVATLFGCWTSAARKAVLPVVEAHNVLLWYPVQYEGLEASKNIFYTGACANQQVEPALDWLLHQGKQRLYLLGSEYVFPYTANRIVKAQWKHRGGDIAGEAYLPLEATDFSQAIATIQQAKPDAVFSTLNGECNLHFYQQYQAAGITPEQMPVMAVSVAETELQHIGAAAAGHYASWSYFQSLDTPGNREFVRQFRDRYGADRVTSDPVEAAYTQVFLWKQAVELAQSFESDRVRLGAIGQSFQAPGGVVRMEPNHHVWKNNYIGRILPNGQFEVVSASEQPIKPMPWLGWKRPNFRGSEMSLTSWQRCPTGSSVPTP
ncbi:MAG: ABC transporter substrate-binding protein [Coleofasciculaceae cyanobacterium SM2_3_26]|nr:ABC transporter substrate-binding protein [Coleofasciculaceae cyanobacterium SM2_3_26]